MQRAARLLGVTRRRDLAVDELPRFGRRCSPAGARHVAT
jgi:hypothetical protein